MEASEAQELHEQHERAAENRMHAVSFTMSLLAVLVAVVTVLGHRTHTEAVLHQARASDEWNFYQARKIRQYNTELTTDLLGALAVRDQAAASKVTSAYQAHLQKWNEDLAQTEEKARELEKEVADDERRANHFDLGEALLEIGLVITSITLLTRQRGYWYFGMTFGAAGVAIAAWAFLVR